MDTVVYDRIEDVLGRIESLYGRVEDTYLVAKDILLGTQISDWIADLKASGTASATYSDASRMNVLIANEDAANNSDVAKYLVQWAVANNKYGTYCGAACGAVSGVTWDSLTTPNAVMGNATAFAALCGNSVAIYEAFRARSIRLDIWNNLNVCDSIVRSSTTALQALNRMSKTELITNLIAKNLFLFKTKINNSDTFSIKVTCAPNGEQVTVSTGYGIWKDVNRFVSKIEPIGINGAFYTYVDFS